MHSKYFRYSLYIALGALFMLAPLWLQSNYWVRVLILVCIFGVASTGWNLLGGYASQFSLGHSVFFGIGAYATVIFQGKLGLSPWLSIPVGVAATVLVAVIVGWPSFKLTGHYFALATLALFPVFHILASYFKDLTGGPSGISVPILESGIATLQFDDPAQFFYVVATLLLLALVVSRWVKFSAFGLRLDAIRQNPEAARLAGVNMFNEKMKALVISAAVTSVAGSFYGAFLQFLDADTAFSWTITINIVLFAIVGGTRFWWGPALGALILIPLSEYASMQLTGNLAALGQLAYGVLLIVLIIFQPRGLGGVLSNLWNRSQAGAKK
ncbi:MAG: branched-chain amino acid ABC transporter permease [Microbacteriaceae bacterium]